MDAFSTKPNSSGPTPAGRGKVIPQQFFARPALVVARELLGMYLVRRDGRRRIASQILETEAYVGPEDLASHSAKGLTPRTAVMFGPAGRWYLYFTYGMHWMLNVVVEREGYPAAVLIRSVKGAAGPGRVTKFFGIGNAMNGLLAIPASGLWIEDRGVRIPRAKILASPRVGIQYAGPVWSAKPYRFSLSPMFLRTLEKDLTQKTGKNTLDPMAFVAAIAKKSKKPS